ncbi:MAG: cytochrome c oxidase subunit II [Rhodospirillaceae bacterium]|nr:cytochrome c oxidase subunit II [Rhodospirillaceae bacterium]MBT5665808.1 cytochrome c oxidase subunit II [Rhodospirillaceae bacterium]MBT5809784.1 cytochrome c oxidase subunit II [Rhodospirillaceae bacterium]
MVTVRLAALAAFFAGLFAGPAFSAEPQNWRLGLQEAATPTMERIDSFHDFLNIIITLIVLFVLALMLYTMWRFSEKRNPTPSKTTHHTGLEIAWTVIPVFILIIIAIPSFKLLYFADRVEEPDMTLKIVGHQWYWSYEYPDHGNFTFDANMVAEDELKPGQKRLMDTDNRVVLPVGKKIQLLMTSDDVIHNWGMPSFGIKLDTVPGRLNETWVQINKPGVYYGFCSELCGVNHSYMPIAVEAVSEADFKKWVKKAQKEFASADDGAKPNLATTKKIDKDVTSTGMRLAQSQAGQ